MIVECFCTLWFLGIVLVVQQVRQVRAEGLECGRVVEAREVPAVELLAAPGNHFQALELRHGEAQQQHHLKTNNTTQATIQVVVVIIITSASVVVVVVVTIITSASGRAISRRMSMIWRNNTKVETRNYRPSLIETLLFVCKI